MKTALLVLWLAVLGCANDDTETTSCSQVACSTSCAEWHYLSGSCTTTSGGAVCCCSRLRDDGIACYFCPDIALGCETDLP